MRHRCPAVVALVVVAAVLGGCGGDDPAVAPSFGAVEMSTGAEVGPETVRGVPTLLAAWATWCPPCERELPELEAALPRFEAAGVGLVAVNVDAPTVEEDDVVAMLDRLAPSLDAWRDDDSSILTAFESTFMPFSALIDAEGRVIHTWNGAVDPDEALELATG